MTTFDDIRGAGVVKSRHVFLKVFPAALALVISWADRISSSVNAGPEPQTAPIGA